MEHLLVRQLSAGDSIEALTDLLHRGYAALGAQGLNYTAVNQTPETTVSRIRGGQCYVAELRGTVVGTVLVHPTDPVSLCEYFRRPALASIAQFSVEPSMQRRGIGHALIAAAEAWAIARGCREIALDTAEPADHLIAFYTRLGYATVGHVQWPGKTYRSVVMSRPLAADVPSRRSPLR